MSEGSDDDGGLEDVLASDKDEEGHEMVNNKPPRKRLVQQRDEDEEEAEQGITKAASDGGGEEREEHEAKRVKRERRGNEEEEEEDDEDGSALQEGDLDIKADVHELTRKDNSEGGGGEDDEDDDDQEVVATADDDAFIVQDKGAKEDADDIIRTEGGWENDSDIEDRGADEAEKEANMTTFEKKMKEAKLAKKKKKAMDPLDVESKVTDLINAMMTARDQDVIALRLGKPALNKIRLLPEVEHTLKKVELREPLLDAYLLRILKTWIDLLPNNDFPCQPIRTRVLAMLDQLPVDADWPSRMEESDGLTKLLKMYSKKEPHAPNARVAQGIINRWSRTLTGTEVVDPERKEKSERKRREMIRELTETQRAAEEFEKQRYLKKTEKLSENFARPAERLSLGNFAKRPEPGMASANVSASKVAESERMLSTSKLKSLERASKKIKATGQAGLTRADNVSVQGRDLHK